VPQPGAKGTHTHTQRNKFSCNFTSRTCRIYL